jgi:hypothetical protein
MSASRSSKTSRNSRTAWTVVETLLVALLLAGLSLGAVAYHYRRGHITYYGDAEAHLNIARRVTDSRTPNWEQMGTVWLPLPHLLMSPLARQDRLWRNALAGTIPVAACFVIAGVFLYAAARRVYPGRAAAVAAVCLLALNPNLLYLQATPMSEPVMLAALAALLYFTVRFRQTQGLGAALGAGLAALAGTLTRYEGWLLIPFVVGYFLLAAKRRRLLWALLFGAVASLGPVYWLGHNWWYYGNALEFANGPYSALAIYRRALAQGMARYPGDGDWLGAWTQYRAAVRLCAGAPLYWIGIAGVAAALFRGARWAAGLLALPPAFYVWSIQSSGTPVFVPELWPHTYYNTRYGLTALPLLALAGAAWAALAPRRLRVWAALAVVGLSVAPWLAYPRPEAWITWKESQVNSEGRRAWTREAAEYWRTQTGPGDGIFMCFGDLTGILREAGLPLAASLHEGNHPEWEAAVGRPDLFLRERWAVAISGDQVATAVLRAGRSGPKYECVKRIALKGAPVIEIYRRAP